MPTTVVTVDRTKTVSVIRNEPALTTVVATSPVTTVSNPAPVPTEVERPPGTVDVVLAGQQGPRGPQGVAGPAGPTGAQAVLRTADQALGGHRIVRSTGAGTVDYADASQLLHGDDTLGLTTNAAAAGDAVNVLTFGSITESSWAFVPQQPVFLGANGLLVQVPAAEAAFLQQVGYAEAADTLFVDIDPPIYY